MILLALCAALITSACGCSAENGSQPSSDTSSSSSAISEASTVESDSSSDKENSNASSGKEDISSSSESDNSSSSSADKTDRAESTSDISAVTSTAASENSPRHNHFIVKYKHLDKFFLNNCDQCNKTFNFNSKTFNFRNEARINHGTYHFSYHFFQKSTDK